RGARRARVRARGDRALHRGDALLLAAAVRRDLVLLLRRGLGRLRGLLGGLLLGRGGFLLLRGDARGHRRFGGFALGFLRFLLLPLALALLRFDRGELCGAGLFPRTARLFLLHQGGLPRFVLDALRLELDLLRLPVLEGLLAVRAIRHEHAHVTHRLARVA